MAGRAGGLRSDYKARRLLTEGGALTQLSVKALEKGVKRLRDLDSVPGLDRNVRKKIEEARQALTAGLFGVNKGTSDLLRGSGMEYAANKKMREVLDSCGSASGPCNLIDAINACGVSSASGGAVCSITSGSTVPPSDLVTSHRLRPIDVNGIKIDQPANGHRYQNKEAVRVLFKARNQGGVLKHIFHELKKRTWIWGSYTCWLDKVRKVQDVVDASPGNAEVEAIINARFHDHSCEEGPCKAGNHNIMTASAFENAVRARTTNEHECKFADYKEILLHAKQQKAMLLAQDPASVSVSDHTVRNYMQLLGVKTGSKVRRTVSGQCQSTGRQ